MLQRITRALRGRSPRPTLNAPKKKVRPLLEQLEDRMMPAHLAVTPQEGLLDLRPSEKANVSGPSQAPAMNFGQMFQDEMMGSLQDGAKFHALMDAVYGDAYDHATAERYRQMALNDDTSFLPQVQFLNRETLHGGNGAYDAGNGIIYLARDLTGNVPLLRQTLVEEVGHHLDVQLNKTDTRGDEGELFRRLVSGEKLDGAQLARVRAANDHGVIAVGGNQVEVEFSLRGKIKKAAKAVKGAAESVASGVKSTVGGVTGALGTIGNALAKDFAGGVIGNLVRGKVGAAVNSLIDTADKIVLQAPAKIVNGAIDGAEYVLKAPTHLLPGKAGTFARDLLSRIVDVPRTVVNHGAGVPLVTPMIIGIDGLRTMVRAPLETTRDFVNDIANGLKLAAKGEWSKAFEAIHGAITNVGRDILGAAVDIGALALQGAFNIVGDAFYRHKPPRTLTATEKEMLEKVFGGKVEGSLDLDAIRIYEGDLTTKLGLRSHVVGNNIYLSKKDVSYDGMGNLTPSGLVVLAHEAAHVWQNQNGGPDYIHDALGAQAAHRLTGSDAYAYVTDFKNGVTFDRLNREQQAHLIDDIAEVVIYHGHTLPQVATAGTATRAAIKAKFEVALGDEDHNGVIDSALGEKKVTLSDADFTRLVNIWADVQAGRGVGSRGNLLRSSLRIGSLSIPAAGAAVLSASSAKPPVTKVTTPALQTAAKAVTPVVKTVSSATPATAKFAGDLVTSLVRK